MSYFIEPSDYDLKEEGILIVYDRKQKSAVKKLKLIPNKIFELKDENIIENINNQNYVFKIRTNKGIESKDLTEYFYLIKKQNFTDYWLDRIELTQTEILNHINYFSNPDKLMELRNSFYATTNNILINFNGEHINLNKYLDVSKKFKLPSIIKNINTYFIYLLKIKKTFKNQKFNSLYYDDFIPLLKTNEVLYKIITDYISELDTYNLQFINYLKGCLYSMISERENAVNEFSKGDLYNNNYGVLFGIGQGTSTYISEVNINIKEPEIKYYNIVENNKNLETIIISVDERFLRNYGTIILNNILTLRKYQFHIHVVGKNHNIIKAISELDLIYDQMVKFFDKDTKIFKPSFSYEFISDEISDINTYSACARFIHANKFMEKFNTSLYIMDADCIIVGDIEQYSKNFIKRDIGIALSRSLSPLMPWKRLLAGDSYFAKTDLSKKFLKLTSEYILSNLSEKKAWTLDQNALDYAYEKLSFDEEISIINVYKLRRPFLHAPISGLIERK